MITRKDSIPKLRKLAAHQPPALNVVHQLPSLMKIQLGLSHMIVRSLFLGISGAKD